ncbi:MAG: alpha/beta hydrolase [Spirochaetes bacterium]|nr:alpha/beta hydrolase [Spirochaetota bacterium]
MYAKLHPVKQFDFQINRIITYGEKACDFREVKETAAKITDFDSWFKEWKTLGLKAEKEQRFLHAAYYYRLAEFFLTEAHPEKEIMYKKSIENFHKIISKDQNLEIIKVPYKNGYMKTFLFKAKKEKARIIVFGGYDSFIEEFYLAVKDLADAGYTVYMFEGPGQGKTLKQGIKFTYQWEKPVTAIFDYFKIEKAPVVGISWGGYFVLRAAAFEKRITEAIAFDILYDGFDFMTSPFPFPMKQIFKTLFFLKAKDTINRLVWNLMKKKILAQWAIEHGQYITGTKTPFDFYTHIKQHTLKGIEDKITCNVLLLAGEKDHYIPLEHYYILMKKLKNAKSLTGRIFTEEEGGQEHCQTGNHKLAIDYIVNWLDEKYE